MLKTFKRKKATIVAAITSGEFIEHINPGCLEKYFVQVLLNRRVLKVPKKKYIIQLK